MASGSEKITPPWHRARASSTVPRELGVIVQARGCRPVVRQWYVPRSAADRRLRSLGGVLEEHRLVERRFVVGRAESLVGRLDLGPALRSRSRDRRSLEPELVRAGRVAGQSS